MRMKVLHIIIIGLNILFNASAFTPCIISSTQYNLQNFRAQELNLIPDQAPELEEAAKQWLDAASKLEEEQDYHLNKSKSNRIFGSPLSASGSTNKMNKASSQWWSRAFNRLIRRNNTRDQ